MYLIVKCEELMDQYECDADRTPITLTEDWRAWFNANQPRYLFEVYEFREDKFVEVKDMYTPIEKGMALYFWTKGQWRNDNDYTLPTVVYKWTNMNRDDALPECVSELAKRYYDDTEEMMEKELKACGYISWEDDAENWWVYGSYSDNLYDMGC